MYYWNKNTLVYVIGRNGKGQLGLGHHNKVNKLTQQKYQYQIQHIYNGAGSIIYSEYDNKNYYSCGENGYGACCLGTNDNVRVNKLTKITLFIDNNIIIKQIFTNNNGKHIFWMDINHNIYGNGWNKYHQLGLNYDTRNKHGGIQIKYLKNIKDIQCASGYSLVLGHNNNVFSSGTSRSGGLGHGASNKMVQQFTKIKELNNKNIIKIKTGLNHSLFLSSDYNLYGCGQNGSGQLGLGLKNNAYTPIIIDYFKNNNIKIIDIECGFHHNLCIDINYNIYSFGWNISGQCGLQFNNDPDYIILVPQQITALQNEKIVKIKCGSFHSYCLSKSNNHYLWGSNYNNQCIVNAKEMQIIKTPCLMNAILKTELNNQRIKEIFLGCENTQIIVYE